MLPGKTYSSNEIGRIIGRHWWLLLLPFAIGLTAGVVVYKQMPVRYKSDTLITVVPQRARGTSKRDHDSNEDRLPAISDQILSRSRGWNGSSPSSISQRAARDHAARGHRPGVGGRQSGAGGRESFRVSFVSGEAKTAQCHRAARGPGDMKTPRSREASDTTNQFLQSELEEARRRLTEQEKKLETYRKTTRVSCRPSPGEPAGDAERPVAAQQTNQAVNHARAPAVIERGIADAQTPDPVIPAVAGAPLSDDAPAQQKLDAARAQLEAFKRHYTPEHPDVKALERQIADLQVKADLEAKMPPQKKPLSPNEVARQKRLKELQTELEMIDREIASELADIASFKKTLNDYARLRASLARPISLLWMRDYET
jgi:uncharacterized protein involved in exopolysaccharide biosynthesis